jgi:hypothetical protein
VQPPSGTSDTELTLKRLAGEHPNGGLVSAGTPDDVDVAQATASVDDVNFVSGVDVLSIAEATSKADSDG